MNVVRNEAPAAPVATLLVVDDDRINRLALAELFQEDCRILMARDGASALEILGRELVDLVLLDVSMPGMNGYDMLHEMRQNEHLTETPVIFITAMSEAEDEEHGLLLGAADFVHKPIRPAVVRARVMAHLRLSRQRQELEALASCDALTGLSNRRAFDEALDRALSRCSRASDRLAIGLIDVDHFKQYNDFYGHGAGDEALRQVAHVLRNGARRENDMVARYGGEEFVILLPGCSELQRVLDRFREAILAQKIEHQRSSAGPFLTISGGGIVIGPGHGETCKSLLERADQLLYRAKAEGRNRILVDRIIED